MFGGGLDDDLSDDDENGEDQTELQQLRDMLVPYEDGVHFWFITQK